MSHAAGDIKKDQAKMKSIRKFFDQNNYQKQIFLYLNLSYDGKTRIADPCGDEPDSDPTLIKVGSGSDLKYTFNMIQTKKGVESKCSDRIRIRYFSNIDTDPDAIFFQVRSGSDQNPRILNPGKEKLLSRIRNN